MFDTERCCQNGVCKDYFDTNSILICIGLRNFETSRSFSGCLCCQTDGTGCPKCFQMDTSILGHLPFFKFLYEKVCTSDCLTYDGAY